MDKTHNNELYNIETILYRLNNIENKNIDLENEITKINQNNKLLQVEIYNLKKDINILKNKVRFLEIDNQKYLEKMNELSYKISIYKTIYNSNIFNDDIETQEEVIAVVV